ncbi:MAG TPA: hypothetical protein VJA40_04195 [archaeon]|nr:hypothetical protein [archaeon]
MNEKDPTQKNGKKEDGILGIRLISSIVAQFSSGIHPPEQILSAFKQILYFYNLLPTEWKKKAFWIFEKLWLKKQVIVSTTPEDPQKVYETNFNDDRVNQLLKILPDTDKSILLLGKTMVDLIQKGLHTESDNIKAEVSKRYGLRGLNIVNMVTTGDIEYFLEESEALKENVRKLKKFDEWAYDYESIALLISPKEMNNKEMIVKKIVGLAERSKKGFVLLNISGKLEEIIIVQKYIEDLKNEEKLNYKNVETNTSDSGFYKALRIKINF